MWEGSRIGDGRFEPDDVSGRDMRYDIGTLGLAVYDTGHDFRVR